jgi:hypothetical protein
MKKAVFTICLLLITLFSAQAQVFNGVKIDGKVDSVINQFKEKGYEIREADESPADVTLMTGMLSYQKVKLYIVSTPKTKLACRVILCFPEDDSWFSLKSSYKKYLELLTQKYGKPDKNFNSWREPYYEGDGYEIQALEKDKVTYSAYWLNKNNLNVGITINRDKQIQFIYENTINSELETSEEQEKNSTIF